MSYGLTRRQADLLQFIRAYVRLHGCSPSYREMEEGLGLSSRSEVFRLVAGLETRGAIRRLPYRARSIVPVERDAAA